MSHIVGGGAELGWVALKAFLLFVTALVAFRLGERRTLAEMAPFDFVAAIAVGAIVGRVPNADNTSYLAGAVTLVTLLLAHRLIARLRYIDGVARLVDPPPRLLVSHGRALERELRRSGLTHNDLLGLLRSRGITDPSQVSYAVFERRGQVSVLLPSNDDGAEPGVLCDIDAAKNSGSHKNACVRTPAHPGPDLRDHPEAGGAPQ